jgi:cleavage and polyadenylation specificity factor subunit 1
MTVANLEVSEHTHERRPFVAVGTAIITGEDQPTRGKVYVFDVINVVPEPNRPETGFRLKPFAKEEVKGAVTALTEIGPQGFLLVAQGQKCLVRGLVEEQRLLPVAFLDVQCFVTAAKVLKGTGMIILSDLAKGLWFTGYMVSVIWCVLVHDFANDFPGGAIQDDCIRQISIEDGSIGGRVPSP